MLPEKLFDEEKTYKEYKPSLVDKKKISMIKDRLEDMRSARTVVDKDWDTYQKMIDARYEPYLDERSSSVVPLASSIIELLVAEAIKLETKFNFRWENSTHKTAARVLEYVWKYDWRKNKRKQALTDNEYITWWFGTSVIYTGYEKNKKKQKDPIITKTGDIEWKEVEIDNSWIIIENVDIRNFYIDNTVINDIKEASDCIYIQWVSYEKFQCLKTNNNYSNIDKVKPKNYQIDSTSFTTQEDKTRQGKFVQVIKYWNVEKDIYMELANDVLVREHPMISTIDGKKALPFVIRVLGKKNYSIYGRWICEALMMFNSELNDLREMLMDWIRRSNSQVLAIGNGLSFNGRDFSYDNEILTFDGNLAGNFQQISWNPPNQAIFNYLTQLYKDIAVFVWIDIQNIIGDPQQTAFQTEVQREASQKRVNVWLQNRDLAYERLADLYKDLLQKYFPIATAEWLYPQIEIEWEEYVEWKDNKPWKFKKKKGKSMLEVKPEYLRWDIYVDVYTNTTAPTINAVDREQKMQFLWAAWNIVQSYAVAKQSWFDLDKVLPLKDTINSLAWDFNFQPNTNGDSEETTQAFKQLKEQLMNMKRWQNMPPVEAMWEQQPTWEEQLKWQPVLPNNQWLWQQNMWL